MNISNKNLLAGLILQAVSASDRGDAAARDRAKYEAVTTYALCTATEWEAKFDEAMIDTQG